MYVKGKQCLFGRYMAIGFVIRYYRKISFKFVI